MAGAAYDEIADWYEEQFLRTQRLDTGASAPDPHGIDRAAVEGGQVGGELADRMRAFATDRLVIAQ